MRDETYLSTKEARRVHVLERVLASRMTIREAASCLGLSERQVKRLKEGFKRDGAAFLAHKNRGRKPQHAFSDDTRQFIIEQALGPYRDTSCQHMAELLGERDQLQIHAKTISRILKAAHIRLRYTRKSARRRRTRDRKPQAGLLVQIDASPFDWLEERGPYLHLHGAIDDATSEVLALHFRLQEDTVGYLHVLDQLVRRHGVPQSVYSDRHTLFFSPKRDKLTIQEELAGKTVHLTQFGRALQQLGIQHIPARSPQAKGRIERLWGTLQARLVVEMRISGVSSLEDANTFAADFCARFNQRFAVAAAEPDPAFGPMPSAHILATAIALHKSRQASNGSTISYDGSIYRLLNHRGHVLALKPKAPVTVLTDLDGTLSALYQGRRYRLQLTPRASAPTTTNASDSTRANTVEPARPAPDHPWRQYDQVAIPSGKGHFERYLDRLLDEDLEAKFWDEIYAQR